MAIVKQQFTITYERSVDTDTGEIIETKVIDKGTSKPKKVKEDNEKEPKLYLEENKCRFNLAAMSFMRLNAGDKIDIKYDENNGIVPVIGTDEAFGTKAGNKITQTNTFAFRGNKNEELSKFGNEFVIVAHPNKSGLFVLTSDKMPIETPKDENVNTDDIEIDLDGLLDDEDNNSVNSNLFQL